MEERPVYKKSFNLAGIVPCHGQKLDFNFPWHDTLQPIAQDYLAVEKAVLDCVLAGCKTIWIVCGKDMQPLIRYRLGDYINDPIKLQRSKVFESAARLHSISIYYVLFHPKDTDRRDSLAWSIIRGADSAYKVCRKISKWTTPDRYFVSFPYGLFDSYIFNKNRTAVNKPEPFYVTCEGLSFRDGLYLPFTFDSEDFKLSRRKFRQNEQKGHDKDRNYIKTAEAFTGRYLTHNFVFGDIKKENANVMNVPWYFDISSWEGLKKWLSSDYILDKPKATMVSYNEWNPIGVNNEDPNEQDI